MTEGEALEQLDAAIQEIRGLEKQHKSHTDRHVKWLVNTSYLLDDIFGRNSGIFHNFQRLTYRIKPGTIIEGLDIAAEVDKLNYEAYLSDLEIARGLLQAGIDVIRRKGIKSVYETGDPVKESNLIIHILQMIQSQLRKSIRDKPNNEKMIQDSLETIFNVKEFDFLREKEHIEYSSKAYVPDFTFPSISTIVEVKLCNSQRREKDIISEINDDILAYGTKYSNLIFIVYDIGVIRDKDMFRGSFSKHSNVIVEVIKH